MTRLSRGVFACCRCCWQRGARLYAGLHEEGPRRVPALRLPTGSPAPPPAGGHRGGGVGGARRWGSRPARSHGPGRERKAEGGEVVPDAEGHSALTLRLVLASFGLVVCGGAAVLFLLLQIPVIFVVGLALLAVIAAID